MYKINKMNFAQKVVANMIISFMKNRTKKYLNFSNDLSSFQYPKPKEGKKYLLYIHVPFCRTLCPYCSFHKYIFKEDNAKIYFKYLKREIRLIKQMGFEFNALYIGGGTPTILVDELKDLIDFCKENFSIKEVSCEADPNIDDKLIDLLKNDIDRLSIGIQTFDDELLKKIRRYKKFGSSKEQFDRICKVIDSFKVVNCDLIFNLPTQTEDKLIYDLDMIKKSNAHEVSIYPLMYSPLVKKSIEKSIGKISSEHEYEFYLTILDNMKTKYEQISCWSFAKKGDRVFDEYVIDFSEYVGVGSGAFGFIEDSLIINAFALDKYMSLIDNNNLSVQRYKRYKTKDMLYYRLMVDLFGFCFDPHKLSDMFGINVKKELSFELKSMIMAGIMDKNYNLSTYGKYIFLLLMKEFYIGMDYVRESSRRGINKYGFIPNAQSYKQSFL